MAFSMGLLGASVSELSGMQATGGTITDVGGFRIHSFTSSGTFEVTANPTDVEYLVIAGGGGGGRARETGGGNLRGGGGGGAGGYRSSVTGESSGGNASAESKFTPTITSYTVVVGAGGAGTPDGQTASNGQNSIFDTISSIGGGGAGSDRNDANSGGSGGGRGHNPASDFGTGTANQGFSGGPTNVDDNPPYIGSSGGGAGAVGGNATSGPYGIEDGGIGVQSSISGTSIYRAGGGAGIGTDGSSVTATASGGLGGGAASQTNASNATANTGGGGGAGQEDGSNGGSGVVIIRYPYGA